MNAIQKRAPLVETERGVAVEDVDGVLIARRVPISTEHRDRAGDIVRQKGCRLADYKRNPVVMFGHGYTDQIPVIGRGFDFEQTQTRDGIPSTVASIEFHVGHTACARGRPAMARRHDAGRIDRVHACIGEDVRVIDEDGNPLMMSSRACGFRTDTGSSIGSGTCSNSAWSRCR